MKKKELADRLDKLEESFSKLQKDKFPVNKSIHHTDEELKRFKYIKDKQSLIGQLIQILVCYDIRTLVEVRTLMDNMEDRLKKEGYKMQNYDKEINS